MRCIPFMSTVTVLLATYNGERYLPELLDSIRMQTRQPDEVMIIDDCSKDGTVELIANFIENNELKNWSVSINEDNIGWKANFRKGILKCKSDLIFTCDQDDIWDRKKIELMENKMNERTDLNLLACQVDVFYEGENISYKTDNIDRNKLVSNIKLTGNEFLYTMRPGCTYCIRTSFAKEISPWWKESYPHDATLWRFAAITGTLAVYNRELVKFRRHTNNASTRWYVTRNDRIADIDYYIDFIGQMDAFLMHQNIKKHEISDLLEQLTFWFEQRRELIKNGPKPVIIRNILNGREWYSTWKSPLVDIYFSIIKNGKLRK